MRINSKGQVTIPKYIRERAGLLPNTEIEVTYQRGSVLLKPAGKRIDQGDHAVARLRGTLRHLNMSADELMSLTRDKN